MVAVKNGAGKLVCMADGKNKTVEIMYKGFKTTVRFRAGGKVEVINAKPAV